MSKQITSNLPEMTIEQFKKSLQFIIEGIYASTTPPEKGKMSDEKYKKVCDAKTAERNLLIRKFQPLMIWGAPGIGKSDSIKQIATTLGFEFIDVRLTTIDPVDLRGIPSIDKENRVAEWFQAGFLPKPNGGKGGILFIDEINAVAPSIQAAAYQLVLDKRIGDYILPDGWFILAAGNRASDKAVTFRMSSALANRFTHMEIKVKRSVWLKWAKENDLDLFVINFIRSGLDARTRTDTHNTLFMFDPTSGEIAFATPRSWENVSKLRYLRDQDVGAYFKMIQGTIGKKAGQLFQTFITYRDELPNPEDILSGKTYVMPERYETLYVMISMLMEAIRREPHVERIDNLFKNFIVHLEDDNRVEIAIITIKDLADIAGADKILQSKECQSFINRHVDVFGVEDEL